MMNTYDSSSPSSCCSGSLSCTAALVLGIIALVLALVGFFPCLGWITLIMSIVAVSKGSPKGALVVAIIALVLSAVAGIVQAWMASVTVTYMEQHQDYVEKKALEIQKELRQMEQENKEALRRSVEADGMSPADGTGSREL